MHTKPKATRLPPTAAPYVVKKLRAAEQAIGEAVPRVVNATDEEAIHDLRVAIRRLRTLLKMSRRLFGRWQADVVRRACAGFFLGRPLS